MKLDAPEVTIFANMQHTHESAAQGGPSTAPETVSVAAKTTPVDADQLPLVDSAASNVLKKLTWVNVKATLKTYFDTLYPAGSGTSTGTNTGDNGTVTSVAALTLGTVGTDLSSTVATGSTTAVITLQVPTASAANRGALSAADWSTFNGKQSALSPAALTKTNDTNVTLTLGGAPTTALLQAASITLGWTGFLATGRGGTGVNNSTGGTANQFWARPNGAAGAAAYRAVVAADIPTLNQNTTGTATTVTGATQSSITSAANLATVGTIGTGVWQGTIVTGVYGGTGVNNNTRTMTYAGNVTFTGAFNPTFAIPASVTYTFPSTAATLARTDAAQTFADTQTMSAYGAGIATFSAAGVISSTATTGTGNVVLETNPTLPANLTFSSGVNHTIQIGSDSAWRYSFATVGDDARIFDAAGLDYMRMFYNGGSGRLTLLSNVHISTAGALVCAVGFGCNNKGAQTSVAVNAASTDLASVIALCNQLRAALIANGITV